MVEARRGEDGGGAGPPQAKQVLEVDGRERGLARDEHELALLLQGDRGRAVDEVGHRARGDARRGGHRARADDVAVDAGRPARVRSRVVAQSDDGDAVEPVCQAGRHLVPAERDVAVELGRADLNAGVRDAYAYLGAAGGERLEKPCRIGRARGAGDAEEDVHGPGGYPPPPSPFDSDRNVPRSWRFSSPSDSYRGITLLPNRSGLAT